VGGLGGSSRVQSELSDENEVDEVKVDGQVTLEEELVGEQTSYQVSHIAG
jgi:hypothetical protein